MNIDNQDLRRLPPTEQLRHHVRRGDHRAAIHLALELHDDETARRLAWRATQCGEQWRTLFALSHEERASPHPLVSYFAFDLVSLKRDIEVTVDVAGHSLLVPWTASRARLFAVDCAQASLKHFTRKGAARVRESMLVALSGDVDALWRERSLLLIGASTPSRFAGRLVAVSCCLTRGHEAAASTSHFAMIASTRAHAASEPRRMGDKQRFAIDVLTPLALRRLLVPHDDLDLELTTSS